MTAFKITREKWQECLNVERKTLVNTLQLDDDILLNKCLNKNILSEPLIKEIQAQSTSYAKAGKFCDCLLRINSDHYLDVLKLIYDSDSSLGKELAEYLGVNIGYRQADGSTINNQGLSGTPAKATATSTSWSCTDGGAAGMMPESLPARSASLNTKDLRQTRQQPKTHSDYNTEEMRAKLKYFDENTKEREILRRNHQYLMSNLDVNAVKDYLYQENVLSNRDMEELANPWTTRSNKTEAFLIHMLPRRPNFFKKFISALEQDGHYSYIIDKLESTTLPAENTGRIECDGEGTYFGSDEGLTSSVPHLSNAQANCKVPQRSFSSQDIETDTVDSGEIPHALPSRSASLNEISFRKISQRWDCEDEDAYDFALFYADESAQEALEFKEFLEERLKDSRGQAPEIWHEDSDIGAMGRSRIKNIEYALLHSRYYLLYIDDNFVQDEWSDFQKHQCLWQLFEPGNENFIVQVLTKKDIKKPFGIKDQPKIDLWKITEGQNMKVFVESGAKTTTEGEKYLRYLNKWFDRMVVPKRENRMLSADEATESLQMLSLQ